MDKFFKNTNTAEELKATYKKLCMKYHPDINKDENATAIMQEINNEYTKLWEQLKDVHTNKEGEQYTSKETTTEVPEDFINLINTLLQYNDLTIELIGSWLWITGNTKEHKDILKNLNCKFAPKKVAWYYHKDKAKSRSRGKMSLEEIRSYYNRKTVVRADDKKQLAS